MLYILNLHNVLYQWHINKNFNRVEEWENIMETATIRELKYLQLYKK